VCVCVCVCCGGQWKRRECAGEKKEMKRKGQRRGEVYRIQFKIIKQLKFKKILLVLRSSFFLLFFFT
jgi:hypothetical protein